VVTGYILDVSRCAYPSLAKGAEPSGVVIGVGERSGRDDTWACTMEMGRRQALTRIRQTNYGEASQTQSRGGLGPSQWRSPPRTMTGSQINMICCVKASKVLSARDIHCKPNKKQLTSRIASTKHSQCPDDILKSRMNLSAIKGTTLHHMTHLVE
jgi:hypothetical protein